MAEQETAVRNWRIVAERPGWALYDRQHPSNGWRNFKLVAATPKGKARARARRKRSWWLGFNGERLARNIDAGLLALHQPQIHRWVLDELRSFNPQCLVEPRSQPKLRGMRE
jgi:hypothetical protein